MTTPPIPKRRAVRLPHRVTNGSNRCAGCRSPGATLCCSDCRAVELGAVHTWYCDTACQTDDWPSHKAACNERRRLFRAVRVLSYLWDILAGATFVKPLAYRRHEDLAEGRVVHVVHDTEPIDPGCWTGRSVFRDFPGCAIPDSTAGDQTVVHEMLDHGSSLDSMIYGAALVDTLVSPVCQRLWEAKLDVRDTAVVYKYTTEADPPDYRPPNHANPKHYLFRADLATGGSFAIDLTGRQFGFHEVVYRWRDARRHRARDANVELKPFGHHGRLHITGIAALPPHDLRRAVAELRIKLALVICESVRTYVKEQGGFVSIRVWLNQPTTPTFPAQARDLLRAAQQKTAERVYEMTAREGIGRLYYAFDAKYGGAHVRVTRDEATAQSMRSVWFTPDEVEAVGGKQALLAIEWKNRIGKVRVLEEKRAREIAAQEERALILQEEKAAMAERKKAADEKKTEKTSNKGEKRKAEHKKALHKKAAHKAGEHNAEGPTHDK